jgi:hypothetical protein
MKPVRVAFILFSIMMVPLLVFGQMPRTISFQGVLTDTMGNPKPDGVYTFTFRLYDVSAGGTAIWTKIEDLQVKGGLFSTLLGDVTPFGAALTFDTQYWLGIKPGSV